MSIIGKRKILCWNVCLLPAQSTLKHEPKHPISTTWYQTLCPFRIFLYFKQKMINVISVGSIVKHVPNLRILWSELYGGLHSLSAFVQFDLDKSLKSCTIAKYSKWSSAVTNTFHNISVNDKSINRTNN